MYEVFFLCGGARGGTPLIFDMACGYDNNTYLGNLLEKRPGPLEANTEYFPGGERKNRVPSALRLNQLLKNRVPTPTPKKANTQKPSTGGQYEYRVHRLQIKNRVPAM